MNGIAFSKKARKSCDVRPQRRRTKPLDQHMSDFLLANYLKRKKELYSTIDQNQKFKIESKVRIDYNRTNIN